MKKAVSNIEKGHNSILDCPDESDQRILDEITLKAIQRGDIPGPPRPFAALIPKEVRLIEKEYHHKLLLLVAALAFDTAN